MDCKMYPLQLTDSQISYADTDLSPNVHVILTLPLTLPVCSCACERSFLVLRCLKTWCRATITENRVCELVMLHVHDTVGQVNPEVVLKRWKLRAIKQPILHSPTKYCHLKLFIKILL
jgi:hypothetical protein